MKKIFKYIMYPIIFIVILSIPYFYFMPKVTVVGEHLDLFDGSHNFVLFKIDSKYDTTLVRKRCYYFADGKVQWRGFYYKNRDYFQLISKDKANLTDYYLIGEERLFSELMRRDKKKDKIFIVMYFKPFYWVVSKHTVKLAGTEDDQKFMYAHSNYWRDPENSLKYLGSNLIRVGKTLTYIEI